MSGVDPLLSLDRAARAGRVRDGDVVLLGRVVLTYRDVR
jgi:hypothetical protein